MSQMQPASPAPIPHRRRLTAFILVITVLAVCAGIGYAWYAATTCDAVASRPGTTTVAAPLTPTRGVLLGGAFKQQSITTRETQLGRTMAIDHDFFGWTTPFFDGALADDAAAGRIPLVGWEPWDISLHDIASGRQDAAIIRHTVEAKLYGQPFFLLFGQEMNGKWTSWSGAENGGERTGAACYVAAWRHIHDVFRAQGVTNAVFVWCPNATSDPREPWNDAINYYPGDAYVDWIGVDGYNAGTGNGGSGWRSAERIFDPFYNEFAVTGKPLMIAETSSAERGGTKPGWIDAFAASMRNRYPRIKAVVWFDIKKNQPWQIDSSPAAFAAFKRLANAPYFNAMPPGAGPAR